MLALLIACLQLTLWLKSFSMLPSNWHGDNFFTNPHQSGLSFSMFTVLHRLLSLVLMFPGLPIEAPPQSTVQGKCIYTFFKQKTRKFNFRSYVLNLIKMNISFCLSKVGSPGADLSALRAQRALSAWPIYQPYVTQQSNRAGRFSSPPCQLGKMFGPIYRATEAKGLSDYKSMSTFLLDI